MKLSCRLLALGCVVFAGLTVARADNWPFWRGPTNNGISKETNVPVKWSATENIAWKLPMPGRAGSTPIVWGDRIFLTSTEGDAVVLMCVSTAGKELWKKTINTSGGTQLFMRVEGDNASPSPSTDGKHVWAFFGTGDFVCYDFEGNEVWKFNAQERYGKFRNMHGMHTTPLLDGDRIYFTPLNPGYMWVIALDKGTGKEIWKVERPTDGRGEGQQPYTSPCMWDNGKDRYLVVHGCDYCTAHRLSDGKEIWRLGDLNPKDRYRTDLRFVSSPLATPELIIVPTAKQFAVVGVKPEATGMINAGSPFEQWRRPKGTPDVPSPLVLDGLLYLCGAGGGEPSNFICMDLKTGKELYNEQLHRAIYRTSPVYADGKIYVLAKDGTMSIIKPGPKFELLGTNKLADTFTSSPVFSNGVMYLRGWQALYAIR